VTIESSGPSSRPAGAKRRRLQVGVTPWGQGGSDSWSDLIRQARLTETLGFDSFFLPESHLLAGARPSPLVALAAIAGATERILLGTTSLLLPLRNPLLLAEEIATLDHVSGGRLILGLGRGFRADTFAAFGVDPRTKRERFEQALATILRAWGIEPRWPGAPEPPETGVPQVEPRPLQHPHPPLWIAAFGPKAIDQAARLGLPYFASPMEPIEVVEGNLARHLAARAGDGGEGEETEVPAMRTIDPDADSRATADALLAATARLGLTHLVARVAKTSEGSGSERAIRALAQRLSELRAGPR